MGDRFRSMIESELAEVDTPPIGDLVDNAIRDGRRLRRVRLVQRSVACVAAAGVLVFGLGMASATLRPDPAPGGDGFASGQDPPPAVSAESAEPPVEASRAPGRRASAMTVPPDAPTMPIFLPDTARSDAESVVPVAAPETVLAALRSVLPRGSAVAFAGGQFDAFTGVQLFLDRGNGYGLIRVAVTRWKVPPKCEPEPRGPIGVQVECTKIAGAWIETFAIESNCVQRQGINAYRPDGIAIQVNVGVCLPEGAWSAPGVDSVDDEVLTISEAIDVGLDPIWHERSMSGLAKDGYQSYPSLAPLTAFNGVGP